MAKQHHFPDELTAWLAPPALSWCKRCRCELLLCLRQSLGWCCVPTVLSEVLWTCLLGTAYAEAMARVVASSKAVPCRTIWAPSSMFVWACLLRQKQSKALPLLYHSMQLPDPHCVS